MSPQAFVGALGTVFEHSPWIAERAWPRRPFQDVVALHAAMVDAVHSATLEERIALLRAHPDLADKAVRAGALTAASIAEQSSAGLDRLSDFEYERFHRLNTAYRERFGFPFIVAVRGHDKTSILAAFETRLHRNRGEEIDVALAQVADIARFRLEALLGKA
ncbi:MAG: 2-oxo-4-hydroxy-4-carboxy-5-ureidoimidazoline decarboxylase [Gammaproteobacteria bacterium]